MLNQLAYYFETVRSMGTGRPNQMLSIHTLAIAVLGVPLDDNAYLEDVACEAAARKRWEFLVTRIPGGPAKSFNALATF